MARMNGESSAWEPGGRDSEKAPTRKCGLRGGVLGVEQGAALDATHLLLVGVGHG